MKKRFNIKDEFCKNGFIVATQFKGQIDHDIWSSLLRQIKNPIRDEIKESVAEMLVTELWAKSQWPNL